MLFDSKTVFGLSSLFLYKTTAGSERHLSTFNRSVCVRFVKGITILLFLFIPTFLIAQDNPEDSLSLVVRKVIVAGNKETKTHIILRELPFKQGDTLSVSRLEELSQLAKKNVYNTTLFMSVEVYNVRVDGGFIDFFIMVKERWYILPFPYVELADRSFNVWWQKYDADLRRLSYGINFTRQNLTGHNDNLSLLATAGFTRQISLSYTTPYLREGMKSRMKFGFSVIGSKEIPYISTDSNKLLYYQSKLTIRRGWEASASFMVRRAIKKREWITVSMNRVSMFDSIGIINPKFFNSDLSQYTYPEVEYKLKYDDADNIIYPVNGQTYELVLSKRGWEWSGGVNRVLASGHAYFYRPLGGNWFGSLRFRGQVMLPFDQPYYNTKAIGYGSDYIRGFEFYVIDGVASFMARADIKRKLVSFQIPTFLKSEDYSRIPVTLYAKVFTDAGGAYNKNPSMLANKVHYGGGIGLDIVTLYDLAVSINFSLNSLGQRGIYLHNE